MASARFSEPAIECQSRTPPGPFDSSKGFPMCRHIIQALRAAAFKPKPAPSKTFRKTIAIADVNQLST
jgi:hypothetical protein